MDAYTQMLIVSRLEHYENMARKMGGRVWQLKAIRANASKAKPIAAVKPVRQHGQVSLIPAARNG